MELFMGTTEAVAGNNIGFTAFEKAQGYGWPDIGPVPAAVVCF
jgi:hypothetical protein